jgi:hypothetical protein
MKYSKKRVKYEWAKSKIQISK